MALRLIIFDLDGTLLGPDNRLSARSARALDAARAAGLTLVPATGRGHRAAEMVLAPTTAVEHVICSNGAALYHRPTRAVLDRRPIGAGLLRDLHDQANRGLPGLCWAWETEKGVVPDAGFLALGEELDELRASPPGLRLPTAAGASIDAQLEGFGPTIRALVAHPELARDELLERLGPLVPGELSTSSSSAVFLEVTAPGVDKRAAVQAFCATAGFAAEEVVALGDHLNDLSLLHWAGRGIAMADGHPGVLAEIIEHTPAGHADDGAALAIEALLAEL